MNEIKYKTPAVQAKKNTAFFDKKADGAFFGSQQPANHFFPGSRSGDHPIQTKLTVGQPNDIYEKEADSMADRVVQRVSGPNVQKCEACDKKDKLQRKPIFESEADPIQTKAATARSQATASIQRMPSTAAAPPSSVESGLHSSGGSGSPLPNSTRQQMESGFDADFSDVRIHDGSKAKQMSDDLNAQAFTHGNDIYFNSGKYNPNSREGQHLLAHELTHTIQQGAAGRISKAGDEEAERTKLEVNKYGDEQLDWMTNEFEVIMTDFRNWYDSQDAGDDDFAKRFRALVFDGWSSVISSQMGLGNRIPSVFRLASFKILEDSDGFVSSLERCVQTFHESVENYLLGKSSDIIKKDWPDQWTKIVEAHGAGGDWKALLYQAGLPAPKNKFKKDLLLKFVHEYKKWEWDQHSDSWKGIYKMQDPNLSEVDANAEKETEKTIKNPEGAKADVVITIPDVLVLDRDEYKKDWKGDKLSATFVKVPFLELATIDVGGEVTGEAHFRAGYGPIMLKNLHVGATSSQAALIEMLGGIGEEGIALAALADILHLDNFRASAELDIPAEISASMVATVALKLAASAAGIFDIATLKTGLKTGADARMPARLGGQVSIYYNNGELTFNHRKSLSLDLNMNFFINAFVEAGLLGAHWKKEWNLYRNQWNYKWAMGTEVDMDYDNNPKFEINSFAKDPPMPSMVGDMMEHSQEIHQAPEEIDVPTGTQDDPIEIEWYKPPEDYPQTIELEGRNGPEHFHYGEMGTFDIPDTERLFGEPGSADLRRALHGGSTIEFGVEDKYMIRIGKVMQKVPPRHRLESVQRGFRALMIIHGHNMRALHEEAEHNQDLQFSGGDDYNNIWALHEDINSPTNFLRQVIVYREHDGTVRTTHLGDRALINKYFKVIGFKHF